jgi:hypothetical protein
MARIKNTNLYFFHFFIGEPTSVETVVRPHIGLEEPSTIEERRKSIQAATLIGDDTIMSPIVLSSPKQPSDQLEEPLLETSLEEAHHDEISHQEVSPEMSITIDSSSKPLVTIPVAEKKIPSPVHAPREVTGEIDEEDTMQTHYLEEMIEGRQESEEQQLTEFIEEGEEEEEQEEGEEVHKHRIDDHDVTTISSQPLDEMTVEDVLSPRETVEKHIGLPEKSSIPTLDDQELEGEGTHGEEREDGEEAASGLSPSQQVPLLPSDSSRRPIRSTVLRTPPGSIAPRGKMTSSRAGRPAGGVSRGAAASTAAIRGGGSGTSSIVGTPRTSVSSVRGGSAGGLRRGSLAASRGARAGSMSAAIQRQLAPGSLTHRVARGALAATRSTRGGRGIGGPRRSGGSTS